MSISILCVAAVVSPVGANMLFRHGETGFSVTDPAALILLGTALICVGAWTRSFLDQKRRA